MSTRSKSKARKPSEKQPTVAKRYKVRPDVAHAIEANAGQHGSVGRAIQLSTELLARMPKQLKPSSDDSPLIGKTYKLTPRTVEMIEKLTPQYGTRGNVLAACARLLQSME